MVVRDLGHSLIRTVPSNEEWPKELWGLKLGYRVHNIRYRGDFVKFSSECWKVLDDLGFRWKADD